MPGVDAPIQIAYNISLFPGQYRIICRNIRYDIIFTGTIRTHISFRLKLASLDLEIPNATSYFRDAPAENNPRFDYFCSEVRNGSWRRKTRRPWITFFPAALNTSPEKHTKTEKDA
jgi:hypothetical protein